MALIHPSFALATETSEPNIDGRWRQGALKEEATVREWLAACGPAPVSRVVPGGDILDVSRALAELSFNGGGHSFTTNGCYEALPALSKEAHSFDSKTRTWHTQCATPEGDPRRISVQTSIALESDKRLSLSETIHYEVTVREGKCLADVKRTRAFELVNHGSPLALPVEPPPSEHVPTTETRRTTFVLLVASATALLAVAWIYLAYRKRRTAERDAEEEALRIRERAREKHATRMAARSQAKKAKTSDPPSKPIVFHDGPLVCPTCQREFESPISFCPYDANRLVPLNETRKNAPPGGICPACHRGFNPGVKSCPHDNEELVPYLAGARAHTGFNEVSHVTESDLRGAICPTCSTKSEGEGAFCVRDGTPLAPLN